MSAPITSITQPPESTDEDYVRVRFNPTSRFYTYYSPGTKVGEWVQVPGPRPGEPGLILNVEALGREGYTGPVKIAVQVDPPEVVQA